jgi:hypothetical protein
MLNKKLWILCGIAALLSSLAILQAMASRSAIAQEPNPTPTPKPTQPPPPLTCCDAMNPGGRTIAGPGLQRQMPGDRDIAVFVSLGRVRTVCTTAENLSVATELLIKPDDEHQLTVKPMKTATFCARTNLVKVFCEIAPPEGCPFRWRVDDGE